MAQEVNKYSELINAERAKEISVKARLSDLCPQIVEEANKGHRMMKADIGDLDIIKILKSKGYTVTDLSSGGIALRW